MRSTGAFRFLSVLLFTLSVAFAAVADDAIPVALHPNSRSWLTDTTAILIVNDAQATIDSVRATVESVDGHLVLYASPGVFIAQVPDDGVATVGQNPNVAFITKSPFNAADHGVTDLNATLAIGYFNWVTSGQADVDLDQPAETTIELTNDTAMPSGAMAVGESLTANGVPAGDHDHLGMPVQVNVIYVDAPGAPWSNPDDRAIAYNDVAAAMAWWNDRVVMHFGVAHIANPSFYSIQVSRYASTVATAGDSSSVAQWVNGVMQQACGGTCTWFDAAAQNSSDQWTFMQKNVRSFNNASISNGGDAFTAFLVKRPISTGVPVNGYTASHGGAFWVMGTDLFNADGAATAAHETGHIYWACDESPASPDAQSTGCGNCGNPHGALNANADLPFGANNGCLNPVRKHNKSIMKSPAEAFGIVGNDFDSEYDKVDPFARQQIGWTNPSCWNDVNWNHAEIGATRWEGQYYSDAHNVRMPLVHWSGAPELTRDDGGGEILDFTFNSSSFGSCLPRSTDFSARWRRKIHLQEGEYEFHGTGGDGIRIYVDDLELSKPTPFAGTFQHIRLTEGEHTVLVDYYVISATPSVHVDWTRIGSASCPQTQFISALVAGSDRDFCYGQQPQQMLLVSANSGTPPYRIAVRRNQDLPVTYDMPFRNFYFTPPIVGGDSHYSLASIIDANGCPGEVVGSGADINFDSVTPRINGFFSIKQVTGCSYTLGWDDAHDCGGAQIHYTLVKTITTNNVTTTTTPLPCTTQLSYVDNDLHPASYLSYTLTAWSGDCTTGTPHRNYNQIQTNIGACSTTPSSLAATSISGTYGDQPALTAHLTGNGSPIANRRVIFELNGISAGSGVTDVNGDAHSSAMLNVSPGTYPGGLTARFLGDDAWYGASASADVVVQPVCYPATIDTQPNGSTINRGLSASLSIGVSGTTPINVEWYTGNTRVGIGTGISVSPTWTTQYYAVVTNGCRSVQSRTVTVMVRQPATIFWTTPARIAYGTPLSGTQLNATCGIAGTFVYSPAVGAVLGAGTQTLSVTFTPTDSANYMVTTGTNSLVVNKATPAITWNTPAAITYGTALSATQLNATASVPGTFSYSPASGTMLGAGTQTLSVTFTPNDSTNYATATGSVSLVVNKATPSISWSNPAAITYGSALMSTQLNATANVAGSFTYSPAAGAIVGAGTQTLNATFTPTDTGNYNSASVSVSLIVNKATPSITWSNPAAITYGTALSATQLNATASVAGSFTYSPAAGTTLGAGTRTLSATFTPTDAANYNGASASVLLVVNKATPSITWSNPAAITYGTALSATQLNAAASVAGSFTYSPAAGTTLGAGTQTLSATFTPTDTTNYNGTSASASLVVNKATPSISWSNPAAITYGTALSSTQLNASASVAGSFTYSPAAGAIVGAGTQTLSVTFTPNDSANYATATAGVSLVVDKATPSITWSNPAAITYGSALSATQLNATASVAGSFTYSPAAGAIVSAGTQTLSTTFTPTDTTNYNGASASVSLVVNKATPAITWNPASIAYGTPLGAAHLNATTGVAGTFDYTPSAGTILNVGAQTLSVIFTPSDTANYVSNSATVSISVAKGSQTITWNAPFSIPSNTPLSSAQLNATVAGSGPAAAGALTYDVATGTVLSLGDHTLTATAASTASYDAATKSIVLKVCDPPVITTQPAGATGPTGGYHFTLTATGTAPLTVAWYTASGVLVGTGSPWISVNTTTSYYAIVSNACGSAQSGTFTITMCEPPTITSQPSSFTIYPGQETTLSLGVQPLTPVQQGGGAVNVVWWDNATGTAIGTGATYVFHPTTTMTLYATASTVCGVTRSSNFTITATAPPCNLPSITERSSNVTIGSGNSTTLTVTATGDPTLHYQWHYFADGGIDTPVGTDSSSYNTGVLTLPEGSIFSQIYRYWVVISNSCGTITSSNFDVIVSPGGGQIED